MAMTQQETNGMDDRWGVTLGSNRPKVTKALLVHTISVQLALIRHLGITGAQYDTAFNDALAYVNGLTEDVRGIRR